jgi:dihydrofolate synthase/folylpolyglutamate synthase
MSDIEKYINGLVRVGSKFGIDNIRALLARLGSPQDQVKAIHVAGTIGKGSTCAFIESILRHSGYRTGLYVSPHLQDITERIQINGCPISREKFEALAERVKAETEQLREKGIHLTHFEFLTGMAFLHFCEEKVDYAVVEVGMGGRLDPTNIINPVVSVITPIGLDHTEFLGPTIGQIAKEKCGIIKKDVPVVTNNKGEALEVIKEATRTKGTELYLSEQPRLKSADLSLQAFDLLSIKGLRIRMLGEHQLQNAALAVRVAQILGMNEENIKIGLTKTFWPGRFEVIRVAPMVILDGAHNVDGAKALSRTLARYFKDKKLIFVIGIKQGKSFSGIVDILAKHMKKVFVAGSQYKAINPEVLAKEINRHTKNTVVVYDAREAVRRALEEASDDDIICVTGSLYLVGDVRGSLIT